MQNYVRIGREFRVNLSAAGEQGDPTVVGTHNAYQIFWTDLAADPSAGGVSLQAFNPTRHDRINGNTLLNTVTSGAQSDSNAVYLAGGWVASMWTDASGIGGDASGTGIKAQFLDSAGGKYMGEYLVNTTTAGNQYDGAAAALGANNYVVVWTDESAGTPVIRGQLLATRTKTGGELLISTGSLPATDAVVAPLVSGGFVVAWRTGDASGSAIRAQVYAASTSGPVKAIGEMEIASGPGGALQAPAIASLGGGRFAVAWQTVDGAGDAGIAARIFDSSGLPAGPEIAVTGNAPGAQTDVSIVALPSGGFLVGWTSGPEGARDVYVQSYGADGAPIGSAILVSEVAAGDQFDLSMAVIIGGDAVLSWAERDLSGDLNVKAQVLRLASAAPLVGTSGPDTMTGTAGGDFIYGGDGNDTIRGGDGNDVIRGEGGDDMLYGELGSDVLEGGIGNDRLEDRTQGMDSLDGGDGNDVLFVVRTNTPTVRDSVSMTGGTGDDIIHYEGMGSDLTIDAGDGDDRLELGFQEDVNAVVTLGGGRDLIQFLAPAPTQFRTPVVRITDFQTGNGGDRLDLSKIVAAADPFFTHDIIFRQVGADASLQMRLTSNGLYITLATFQNRHVTEFTSENFGGIRVPATRIVSTTSQNSDPLVGEPAVLIDGAGVTFTNLAGAQIKAADSAATAAGAVAIRAPGVTVENRGLIAAANSTSTTYLETPAITGSEHADRIINTGTILGAVRLGAGDDYFYELINASNNSSFTTLVNLGAGNDTAEFDLNGATRINSIDVQGGEGFDTLIVRGIAGMVNGEFGQSSGIEAFRLIASASASISFRYKPVADNIYLSPGLTMIIPEVFNVPPYPWTAVPFGTLHLEGGHLSTALHASFQTILGTDADETVNLLNSPRATPGTIANSIGSISLGGGNDHLTWGSNQPRPEAADGGAGDDRLTVHQSAPAIDLSVFKSFETIHYYIWNFLTGTTATVSGIGPATSKLLLEHWFRSQTIELQGAEAPGLAVGIGATKLANLAGSTIGGVADRYLIDPAQTASLANNFDNRGTVQGDVRLGAGNDIFSNAGTVGGSVDLGDGNDTYNGLAGGSVGGTVRGGAGDDVYTVAHAGDRIEEDAGGGTDEVRTALAAYTLGANFEKLTGLSLSAQALTGNGLDNVITAGPGGAHIAGGGGADTLSGGAGADRFVYLSLSDSQTGTLDRILNFAAGDKVDLSALGRVQLTFAEASDNNILYTLLTVTGASGTMAIRIDGRIARTDVTADSGHWGTAGDDIVEGSEEGDDIQGLGGNDRLFGRGGNDSMAGGAGNDELDGGAGADAMAGGTGDDVYFVDEAGDTVSENPNEGSDEVRTGLSAYTLGANAERLTGTSGAHQALTGNALDNVIAAGSGGARIVGGGGADTLSGGAGADVFVYLSAADSVSGAADRILGFGAGDRIDLGALGRVRLSFAQGSDNGTAFTLLTAAPASGGTLAIRVDGVVGRADVIADTRIAGTAGDDLLEGTAEADEMDGLGGNDRLFGGAGNDAMTGGAGNDLLDGGTGADSLDGDEGDDQLFGKDGDDTLAGDGGANLLDGGAGTDNCGSSGEQTLVDCE